MSIARASAPPANLAQPTLRSALSTLAFALALAGMVLVANGFGFENPPLNLIGVGGEPANIASSLLAGKGYANPFGLGNATGPTGWSLPAFVGWITLGYFSFGTGTTDCGVFFLFLDLCFAGLAVAILIRCARRHWSPGVARLAALLFLALVILWARRDGGGWSDKFFVMAVNVALLTGHLDYNADPKRRALFSLALLGGLAGLVNVGSHLLAIGLAISRLRRGTGPARITAMLVGAALLPALIWSARHATVLGAWSPPKTNGPFELSLNHLHSRDGILSASAIFSAHPYANSDANARMKEIGEAAFVAEQGALAKAHILAAPLDALSRLGNRALNALVFMQPGLNALTIETPPSSPAADNLLAAGLLARCGLNHEMWVWLWLAEDTAETGRTFAETGAIFHPALVSSRAAAVAAYDRFARSTLAILTGYLVALPATLAAIWLLFFPGRSRRAGYALTLAYALLIAPYILVSHSSGYQSLVLPIQALLLAVAFRSSTLADKSGISISHEA